jgi:hypothetical protein
MWYDICIIIPILSRPVWCVLAVLVASSITSTSTSSNNNSYCYKKLFSIYKKAMSRFIELPQITGSPVLAAVYKNRLLPR